MPKPNQTTKVWYTCRQYADICHFGSRSLNLLMYEDFL